MCARCTMVLWSDTVRKSGLSRAGCELALAIGAVPVADGYGASWGAQQLAGVPGTLAGSTWQGNAVRAPVSSAGPLVCSFPSKGQVFNNYEYSIICLPGEAMWMPCHSCSPHCLPRLWWHLQTQVWGFRLSVRVVPSLVNPERCLVWNRNWSSDTLSSKNKNNGRKGKGEKEEEEEEKKAVFERKCILLETEICAQIFSSINILLET